MRMEINCKIHAALELLGVRRGIVKGYLFGYRQYMMNKKALSVTLLGFVLLMGLGALGKMRELPHGYLRGFLVPFSQKAPERHTADSAGTARFDIDLGAEQKRIEKAFATMKSSEAAAYFQEISRGYDDETIHILEHFVGEELYIREGFDGLALCTDSLLFGCYHGFFAEAFRGEGREFMFRAEEVCKRWSNFFKASGCIHGIGHGLLSLEGQENLIAALRGCDSISYSIPFGNEMCYTGVFMEYNTTTVHGRNVVVRTFNSQEPYDPCLWVPSVYQPACYLQLPHWWNEFMPGSFSKMGELCGEIINGAHKENCFRSIGMIATRQTKQDQHRIAAICTKMPGIFGEHFCIEEAAKLLLILQKPNALELCDVLAASEKNLCQKNVRAFMCDKMHVCDERDR